MAAAKKTLEILSQTDALKTINDVGAKIQVILKEKFNAYDIPCTFSGPESMFGIHFSDFVPSNYRDWKETKAEMYTTFAKHLIDLGIMVEPDSREPWFICEAHQAIDFSALAEKIELALQRTLSVDASVE